MLTSLKKIFKATCGFKYFIKILWEFLGMGSIKHRVLSETVSV